jgi:hypothetical protein
MSKIISNNNLGWYICPGGRGVTISEAESEEVVFSKFKIFPRFFKDFDA